MRIAIVTAVLPLAACVSVVPAPDDRASDRPDGQCQAAPARGLIGETASSDTGARALSLSGASRLRWGPPGVVWTMDYRQDRVNVRYDAAMTITEITCA
ncbi:I78 family peptidase inhibitor [Qipengyuania sp.]|uniref:I78 family peptidase inhibitor n=1 Tax=Qipengyuania sp. TaxID=2004515 RepID=UPI0035C80FE9